MTSPSEVIDAALTATGLSQLRLARAIGVDPSTLWRWRTGRAAMSVGAELLLRAVAENPALVLQDA